MKSKKVIASIEKMPELSHWPDRSKPFDIRTSDVATWIAAQPEVLQWLFVSAKAKRFIRFNADTQTWHGSKTTPIPTIEENAGSNAKPECPAIEQKPA